MPRPTKPAAPKPERAPSVINPRHQAVADALLEGHSESDALRAAGYHPSNAATVMRQETIQGYLAQARSQISEVTTLKRLDVINLVLEAIDMARIQADPCQMLNGADKLAKILGYYAPETRRLELSTDSAALTAKFRQLTDAELIEIAAGRSKVVDGEVLQ